MRLFNAIRLKTLDMIIHGECLEVMRTMESNSISCIVTDPPYGLKFMGKDWDAGLPHDLIWKEVLRICKPGAFLLAFGGTRTYQRLTCAIEDSGWEIRDCIMWIYANGFPKSKGCLKPAYEPIIMARKPGCKVSDNFLNIDECRIPTKDTWCQKTGRQNLFKGLGMDIEFQSHPKGRWPANVVLDEEAAEQIGSRSRFFYCAKASSKERNEGLEAFAARDCGGLQGRNDGSLGKKTIGKNHHPTVKPLALMEYLIKLIMPPKDGILLDPFAGSGTTILAAKNLGFNAIGIEKNLEYYNIAVERIKYQKAS